jgi:hypothetical protein
MSSPIEKAFKSYVKEWKKLLIEIKNDNNDKTFVLNSDSKLESYKQLIYNDILNDEKKNKKNALLISPSKKEINQLINELIKYIK